MYSVSYSEKAGIYLELRMEQKGRRGKKKKKKKRKKGPPKPKGGGRKKDCGGKFQLHVKRAAAFGDEAKWKERGGGSVSPEKRDMGQTEE